MSCRSLSEANLVHSELRKGHAPLILRADDMRQVLLEQGWIELIAPHHARKTNAIIGSIGVSFVAARLDGSHATEPG